MKRNPSEAEEKARFLTLLDALFDEYLNGKTCFGVYDLLRKTDPNIRSISPMFYNVASRSTLVASVLSAHKLYSNDPVSLRAFLSEAEQSAHLFGNAEADEVAAEVARRRAHITSLKGLTGRLAIRRNNGIGHLSEEIVFSREVIEKKMEMTLEEFSGLLEYAGELLNKLNTMWNGQHTLNYIPHHDDYKKMVQILTDHRTAQIQRHNAAFPMDKIGV
jgi:hypothetical protein